jgi:hypothetical protein
MTDNMRNERRRAPRAAVAMVVNYHVLGVIDNLEFAHTKDTSLAGFLLKTKSEIKRGVCLVLEIPWPSRLTPIRLLGRVVESRLTEHPASFDTRIEFLAMNDETRAIVKKLIEHYLEQ